MSITFGGFHELPFQSTEASEFSRPTEASEFSRPTEASEFSAERDGTLRHALEHLLSAICQRASQLQLDGSFAQEIGPLVDQDGLEAPSAEELLANAFAPDRRHLLDFGCGAMDHRAFTESLGYHWRGVEYLDAVSPTVVSQIASHASEIALYDGRNLPFGSGEFDVVYAMLVLHHVQYIDVTFGEISRVLKPGGLVIGQVSGLEQMQDYSTFGFTPYGLKIVAERNGLRLSRIYPKHDAFSFLSRRLLITLGSSDATPFDEMLNPEGYFHRTMIETGERLGWDAAEINLVRLLFCTHFVFELAKA